MRVSELQCKLSAVRLTQPEADGDILNWYAGDLLSHVMAKIPEGACWFTIMNNVNVAAVASLTEAACVVLCEGVAPDGQLLEKAAASGVILFSVKEDICGAIRKAFS